MPSIPAFPFDAKFALEQMLPLAEAAYDCRLLPADWKLIKEIQPDKFGLIAMRGDVAVVAIRGTESQHEWLEDFDAALVPCKLPFASGLRVHCGFQEVYMRIRDSIRQTLAKLDLKALWITGHSLGAALATLCAFDLGDHNPLVFTWAGPRVGTPSFTLEFARRVPACYRIANKWDLVTDVPPVLMGYSHVRMYVGIDGGATDDPKHAHSLELSYRPGLQKLLQPAAA